MTNTSGRFSTAAVPPTQTLRSRMRPPAPPISGSVASYAQDVWWTTKDGLTHLIDDLTDRHRAYIARMLVDRAALTHLRLRLYWYEWGQFMGGYGYEMPDEVFDDIMHRISTPGWVRAQIRKEQDRGQHLDWIRSTPLFNRMVRGVEHLLSPGVMGGTYATVSTAHEGQDGRRT